VSIYSVQTVIQIIIEDVVLVADEDCGVSEMSFRVCPSRSHSQQKRSHRRRISLVYFQNKYQTIISLKPIRDFHVDVMGLFNITESSTDNLNKSISNKGQRVLQVIIHPSFGDFSSGHLAARISRRYCTCSSNQKRGLME